MKKCNRCLIEKDIEEFPPRGNTISFLCRVCKQEYDREYYHKNKEKNFPKKRVSVAKSSHKRKDFIYKIKSVPCKDCKIQYQPWQMQFDHLRDKNFNIGDQRGINLKKLLAEIEKCDIVCANCHADRTYKRIVNNGDWESLA